MEYSRNGYYTETGYGAWVWVWHGCGMGLGTHIVGISFLHVEMEDKDDGGHDGEAD